MRGSTTLVTGGTGKTGRRIAQRLAQRGVPVRIGSRSGEPAFDWQDPASWPAALEDSRAIYIAYSPDLAAPGAAEAIRAFTELAVRQGVQRLVLLSGRGEPEAQRCEGIVRGSGADWTLLQSSWMSQNFSESHFLEAVLAGEVELPAGSTPEPFVDAEDIADVAAAALTEPGHAGQLYELTGPRLLTFAEAVAEISRATGREIRYRDISIGDYAAAMQEAGAPSEIISMVTYLFNEVLDGRNARIADGVARALGRPPRDFGDFARRTAATGVWTVSCEAPGAAASARESAA